MNMLNSIPLWVYLVFFFIVKVGIQASQTRIVPLKKLYIMPAFFIAMAVHNLLIQPSLDVVLLLGWTGATLVGLLIGWKLAMGLDLKLDRANYMVEVPGSWSTLVLMLMIFGSKFFIGYETAANRELAHQTSFQVLVFAISGLCTGIMVGRVIGYTQQLFLRK